MTLNREISVRISLSIFSIFIAILFGFLAGYIYNILDGHSNFFILQIIGFIASTGISLFACFTILAAIFLGWGDNDE